MTIDEEGENMLKDGPTYYSKNEYVYDTLKNNIMSGELKPDTKLTIRAIAKELEVSEMPVREALNRLNSEGLIIFTPYIGAKVAPISKKKIREILFLRSILEPLATELAVDNICMDDIRNLKQIIIDMEISFDKKDAAQYSKLNRAFHNYIYEKSGNEELISITKTLMEKEKRIMCFFEVNPETLGISLQEHREILNLIVKREKIALKELVYMHKKRFFDGIIDYFDRIIKY